jgi:hypothetical protein
MKFGFAQFIGALSLIAIIVSAIAPPDQDKTIARIDPMEGLSIFYLCKPIAQTEYVGTVKVGVTMTNKAGDCLKSLIKRTKKDHPGADALLITDPDFQKADAIRFK